MQRFEPQEGAVYHGEVEVFVPFYICHFVASDQFLRSNHGLSGVALCPICEKLTKIKAIVLAGGQLAGLLRDGHAFKAANGWAAASRDGLAGVYL